MRPDDLHEVEDGDPEVISDGCGELLYQGSVEGIRTDKNSVTTTHL